MLIVYHDVWREVWPEYEILGVETEFQIPLINPETEAKSRSFNEAGKMDVRVRKRSTGERKVVEHKTTQDSVEPDSDYWDRLKIDTQVSKYFLAESISYGEKINSVIYDVLRKPQQRPSDIPLLDENQVKIVCDLHGVRVKTADGKKWRQTGDAEKGWVLQTRPETPEEFETRLLSVLREDTKRFFAQVEVPRLDRDLLEFMHDEWATSQQILYFRQKGIWPRNPDACDQFGKCPMFELCAGRATVDGIRYRVREKAHPELTIQPTDLELLTKTRTSALHRCTRLHKLQYEDRIERVETEEDTPLKFGTLIHVGLESYFNFLKATQP